MHRSFLLLALAAAVLAEEPAPAPAPKPPANPIAAIKTSKGEIQVRLFADETPKTVENFLGLAEGTKEFRDVKTEQMVKRPFYDGLIFHRVIKDFMIQSGCPNGDGTGDPGYRFEDEINADAFGFDKLKVLVDGRPSHPCLQIRNQEEFQANILMPIVRKMGIDSDEALQARSAEVSKKLQETIPNLTVKEALENLGYVYAAGHPSHEPKKGCLAMANSGPNTNGSQFFITLADAPWLTGRHTVFGEVIKGLEVVEAIGGMPTGEEDRPTEEVKILSIRRLAVENPAAPATPAPAGK